MKKRFPLSSGAALIVTLCLVVAITAIVVTFMVIVRYDRAASGLTAALSRSDIVARSAGNLVLGDLLSEIRDGSTNLATAGTSYAPKAPQNMLPARVLSSSGLAADANFARLFKQSVPAPFYGGTGFSATGPLRASGVGSGGPSYDGRLLGIDKWNAARLLSGGGFSRTNDLPCWIYFTRQESADPARLNPTVWSAALADSNAPGYVIGRAAYNIYEIGGCLDLNLAGGKAGLTKQQLLSSLSGARLVEIPGITDAQALVGWRNVVTGTDPAAFLAYAATNGLKAGFLDRPSGDRRFVGRQDLISYVTENAAAGMGAAALPYLTHFSRGLDRPSLQATTLTNLLNGYPSRPAGINPAPLSVRFPSDATLADGTGIKAGDPVAFRRFPLRRLGLVTDGATAVKSDGDPVYRAFGFYRASAGTSWIYDHGANNRILTLGEVAILGREPDFFELLQAAIAAGSLGGSAGPDNFSTACKSRDMNIYLHVLQIGANLIDQYDADDYPTAIQLNDSGGSALTVFGVENLPYLSEIPIFIYRPAALPRTLAQGWIQFELWNPHQNAVSASPYALRVAVTKGVPKFAVKNPFFSSGSYDPGPQYNHPLAAIPNYVGKPATFQLGTGSFTGPGIDFSAHPAYLEFSNGADFQEPLLLGPPSVGNTHAVNPAGTTTPGCIVDETTPATQIDNATHIQFAGIKLDEVVAPDDRVDGIPDQTAYGTPALGIYASFFVTFSTTMDLELQIQTPAGWRTYQRVENFKSCPPNLTPTYNNKDSAWVSGIRPRNFSALLSGSGRLGVATDPRTARFGLYDADSPAPNQSLRPSVSSWAIPGGGTFSGAGWTTSASKNPLAFLASNLSNNPYVSADFIYYADPDGTIRRGDGEERSSVPAASRVFPLVPARLSDRPLVLNRPFDSVGDMGYAFRDVPWKTLDFWTRDSGDAGLLDYFTIEETALDGARHPLRAGVVNPNAAPVAVLKSILEDATTTELGGASLSASDAQTLAAAIRSALDQRPMASLADLSGIADDDVYGPGTQLQVWRKTEKEAFLRALQPVSDVGTWNVMIDLIAQAGRFPPSAGKLDDFVVQAESHYWIFAAIDRATDRIIDIQYETVSP